MGDKPKADEAAKTTETRAAPVAKETKPAPAANELTAAMAAKRVTGRVRVPAMKDGEPVAEKGVFKMAERNVKAEDVLSFAERDGKVTVVTIDGQKLHEAA